MASFTRSLASAEALLARPASRTRQARACLSVRCEVRHDGDRVEAPRVDRRAVLSMTLGAAAVPILAAPSSAEEYPYKAVAKVKGLYASYSEGDTTAVVGACGPKVAWSSTWNGADFKVKGQEGVGKWFQYLGETLDIKKVQPLTYTSDDDGDEVIVRLKVSAVARRTGKPYEAIEFHTWTMDEKTGTVLAFKAFTNTKALYDADPTPPPS